MAKSKFSVSIFLQGHKLPIENKVIEAHNLCSALIIMGGQLAFFDNLKTAKQVTIVEQIEIDCNSCQGGGCPSCQGYGYVLNDKF